MLSTMKKCTNAINMPTANVPLSVLFPRKVERFRHRVGNLERDIELEKDEMSGNWKRYVESIQICWMGPICRRKNKNSKRQIHFSIRTNSGPNG